MKASILILAAVITLAVPFASAQNPATPAGEITDLSQVVAEVPRDALLAVRSGSKKEAAATQATDILRTKVENRVATLRFKLDKVEKYQRREEKQDRYRIKAEDDRIKESVTSFKVFLWVHLDPTENAKVSGLKKGSTISVTGKVTLASITPQSTPELHIDLGEAKLNK